MTATEGTVEYCTECGGEIEVFSDTLVIPKGTTLYFDTVCHGDPDAGGSRTCIMINGEEIKGECAPFTFTEDASVVATLQEC